MKKFTVLLFLCIAWATTHTSAQEFSFEEFIQIIKVNHPVARQAAIFPELGAAQQLMARGGFDPKIDAGLDHKSFDGKNYFRTVGAQLKIPTWFGIELKGGYERASGEYLDNSDFLPPLGLWNAGINITLGKGLIIDERRAMLKQAEVYLRATEQERILLLNQLFFEATLSYLEWQGVQQALRIANEGLQLATARFEQTKSGYINGDLPAIDTLEAYMAVQSREQLVIEMQQELVKVRQRVEMFLWQDGFVPLELNAGTVPEGIEPEFFLQQTEQVVMDERAMLEIHPELLKAQFKIEQLEIDRRLQVEALKPDFQISYQPLVAATEDALFASPALRNYKLGASFAYPLFTRKERGKVRMTDLKLLESNLDLENKRWSIQTKLKAYRNELDLLYDRVILADDIRTNADLMRLAEYRKFDIGESSVFLVNSREVKFLESQLKLVETQVKLIQARIMYLYLAGQLPGVV